MTTKQFVQTVAICLAIMMLWSAVPRIVEAVFTPSPRVWDASFETEPANTDPVSEGDDNIRQVKEETRRRAQVELDFSTLPVSVSGTNNDNGRLRPGAARSFSQSAAPVAIDVADDDASSALDDGRMWVDTDGAGATTADDNTFQVRVSGAWVDPVVDGIVPTNGIVLWAEATGDENCDGVTTAGDCPCGFTRDATFDGIFPRGADTVAVVSDVPEEVGTVCDNAFGGGVAGACDAGATQYQDLLTINEMPSHTHTMDVEDNHGGTFADIANANGTIHGTPATDPTGGDAAHLHPFKTVVFCKKS